MKKNGFTLVELIAVLVILSIIALLATPNIVELMKNSKQKSFISDVEEMVSTAKYMYKSVNIRETKFTAQGSGFSIAMANLNGAIPESDPFGYKYDKSSSYIYIAEPASDDSPRIVIVNIKSCKNSTCHYVCSENGNNLTVEDIKDSCTLSQ